MVQSAWLCCAKQSSHFPVLGYLCVAPEVFYFIKCTRFRVKNVYDGIEIVHQYPLGVARPFGMRRRRVQFVLYFFENTVADGFYMGIGVAFTNNEKIGGSVADLAEVQLNDIFALFITNTFNNEVVEFFRKRIFNFYPWRCCQIQDKQNEKLVKNTVVCGCYLIICTVGRMGIKVLLSSGPDNLFPVLFGTDNEFPR